MQQDFLFAIKQRCYLFHFRCTNKYVTNLHGSYHVMHQSIGITMSILTSPIWTVKTKMQIEQRYKKNSNSYKWLHINLIAALEGQPFQLLIIFGKFVALKDFTVAYQLLVQVVSYMLFLALQIYYNKLMYRFTWKGGVLFYLWKNEGIFFQWTRLPITILHKLPNSFFQCSPVISTTVLSIWSC